MSEEDIQIQPAVLEKMEVMAEHIKMLTAKTQSLPSFYALTKTVAAQDTDGGFYRLYSFIMQQAGISKAQLFQDLFVFWILDGKMEGKFLEFGATDGLSLSNSHTLEHEFKWTGVLAEPSPQWHEKLKANRPDTTLLFDCIWTKTGQELDFFVSDHGVLSTLSDFRESDKASMPGNTSARNSGGSVVKVKTISLNDVFVEHFDSSPIDYMSVDTEGSEYEILKNFNFEEYGPTVLTVEHNFTDLQEKIDNLLFSKGYVRAFKAYTDFDAWYVKRSFLDSKTSAA
ncbi:MAG: FkbM family methyltransferase [Rhizobiaceae bacterium]